MENNVKNVDNNDRRLTIFLVMLGIVVLTLGGVILYNKKEDKNLIDNKKYDELVKIDASTATQPLTDAYIKNLDNFNIEADYTKTDQAYTKLINKEVDLIIVTSPSDDELKRAKEASVELEVTPVVNEGFVFYTNVSNSLDNLKLENIRKIYAGEVTNWREVGGSDAPIIAYQRPVNSGSQTGILSLVMKDKKMKEPKKEEIMESMAGIIDVVSNYENGRNAIGYSYYYYATIIYGNDKMKFFSVDGVLPSHDSIKDESYPLVTSYYIVTLKNNKKEAVQKLKETMLSSRGQQIAKDAGYVELS